ncbi:redoxin domain-containing protein [Bacteroidales bacterium AH-315-I05]|nr:redoxin domain-containing protein [Bacteroidales bacterium AH-315-I05]
MRLATAFFISLLLLACSSSNNDAYLSGKGIDSQFIGKYLYLFEIIGHKTYPVDSVLIDDAGDFAFENKNYETGYYQLTFNDTNKVDIILNQTEKAIRLEFTDPRIQHGINVLESNENKILWEYKLVSKAVQNELKAISIVKSYISDQSNSAKIQPLLQKEDSLNDYKEQFLEQHSAKYPNTYFARSVKAMTHLQFPTKEEQKAHFFDHVDFSDVALVRSSVFPSKIMQYLQQHTEYSENGFKQSADEILERAQVNPLVYELCLNYMLELFHKVGPPVIFQYLTEEYVIGEGCTEVEISELVQSKINAYRNLQAGKIAPDVTLPDTNGRPIKLSEIVSKNKFTLLFFWSSDCSFCEEAIPEIKHLYADNDNETLQIIALSLDHNKADWVSKINEKNLNWLHLSDLKGWDSKAADSYEVHKTPAFYLLNSKMIILAKPANTAQLNDFLSSQNGK